jgi:uncharacterized membrane protein HdeD (DUF308 family)
MQDPVSHPSRRWGKCLAEQWALFVVLGIVAGGMFWIARQALILGIVVGCFALVVGCVIGMTRLERWMEAGDQERQ